MKKSLIIVFIILFTIGSGKSENVKKYTFPILSIEQEQINSVIDTCIYYVQKKNMKTKQGYYFLITPLMYCKENYIIYDIEYLTPFYEDFDDFFYTYYKNVSGAFRVGGYRFILYDPKYYPNDTCQAKQYNKTQDSLSITLPVKYSGEFIELSIKVKGDSIQVVSYEDDITAFPWMKK